MEWLFIEALVAFLLGAGIVWWTTAGLRRRRQEDEQEDGRGGKR